MTQKNRKRNTWDDMPRRGKSVEAESLVPSLIAEIEQRTGAGIIRRSMKNKGTESYTRADCVAHLCAELGEILGENIKSDNLLVVTWDGCKWHGVLPEVADAILADICTAELGYWALVPSACNYFSTGIRLSGTCVDLLAEVSGPVHHESSVAETLIEWVVQEGHMERITTYLVEKLIYNAGI